VFSDVSISVSTASTLARVSVVQAIVAGAVRRLRVLVGILAVGGPRTGLPTLTQTRFAFGFHGNKLPTAFAYLSNVGWKITIITLASTTGASLFARLWPGAFAGPDGHATTAAVVLWFRRRAGRDTGRGGVRPQVIIRVEKWIAWVTAVMTVVFVGMILPHIHWGSLGATWHGSWWTFLGGAIMAMTMVGIGFLNYGGDFAATCRNAPKPGA